ncbi:MAG: TIGR01777 family oxidoreductase [Bacteroidota bacterium]
MKILITGATGLIGQAIVKELVKRKAVVHYLTTDSNKIQKTDYYKGFLWNPEKEEIDIKAFDGVTSVINLAGASISKRWTTDYKKKVLDSRLQSLRLLNKAIVQKGHHDIKSFVSASAIGVYPHSLTSLYTENERQVDDSFLGSVVSAWENEIATFNNFEFNVATIRVGLVLSLEGGALPQMAKPIQNYVGAAFGSGEQWQSWIHIHDLARMFVFVLDNGLKGTFNGVAPNPVTNLKFTKALAKVLQKPLLLPNVPASLMRVVLGEMAYLLFSSQRVSSKRIEKKGFLFQYQNISGALQDLLGKDKTLQTEKTSLTKEFI